MGERREGGDEHRQLVGQRLDAGHERLGGAVVAELGGEPRQVGQRDPGEPVGRGLDAGRGRVGPPVVELVGAVGFDEGPSQRPGVVDAVGRRGVVHALGELAHPSLDGADGQQDGVVQTVDLGDLEALPGRVGLGEGGVGRADVAAGQGDGHVADLGQPGHGRIAGGALVQDGAGLGGGAHVGPFEGTDHPRPGGAGGERGPTDLVGQRAQLDSGGEALVERLGATEGVDAEGQHLGDDLGLTDVAGQPQRLVDGLTAARRRLGPPVPGQLGRQHGRRLGAGLGRGVAVGERQLEQGDALVVDRLVERGPRAGGGRSGPAGGDGVLGLSGGDGRLGEPLGRIGIVGGGGVLGHVEQDVEPAPTVGQHRIVVHQVEDDPVEPPGVGRGAAPTGIEGQPRGGLGPGGRIVVAGQHEPVGDVLVGAGQPVGHGHQVGVGPEGGAGRLVPEGVAAAVADDHTGLPAGGDGVAHGRLVDAGGLGRAGHVDDGAEGGGGGQHRACRIGDPGGALGGHGGQVGAPVVEGGDLEVAVDGGRLARRTGSDDPAGDERAQDLDDGHGRSAAEGVQPVDHGVEVGQVPEHLLGDGSRLVGAQRLDLDALHRSSARRQPVEGRAAAVGVEAVDDAQQEPSLAGIGHHGVEQVERRVVGVAEVVDHQQDRVVGRDGRQPRHHGVGQRAGVGPEVVARGRRRQAVAQLGGEGDQAGTVGSELGGQHVVVDPVEPLAQRIGEGLVRPGQGVVTGAAPQDAGAVATGLHGHLGGQPAGAGPGGTLEQQHRRLAGAGRQPRLVGGVALEAPADEGQRAVVARHRRQARRPGAAGLAPDGRHLDVRVVAPSLELTDGHGGVGGGNRLDHGRDDGLARLGHGHEALRLVEGRTRDPTLVVDVHVAQRGGGSCHQRPPSQWAALGHGLAQRGGAGQRPGGGGVGHDHPGERGHRFDHGALVGLDGRGDDVAELVATGRRLLRGEGEGQACGVDRLGHDHGERAGPGAEGGHGRASYEVAAVSSEVRRARGRDALDPGPWRGACRRGNR